MKASEVMFDEAAHTYHRGDEPLSGITGLIKSVLQLGTYPQADDQVREIYIPRAGYYGTCLHRAIETYETLGVFAPQFPAIEHETEHFGTVTFPEQDVTTELQDYIRLKEQYGWNPLGVEFTVDYGQYASQIDLIVKDMDGLVVLMDHKTNNLTVYPGGKEAFLEYVSWQLSCYAFMFERQTGIKVDMLMCDWYHHGDTQQFTVTRQPDDDVERLLNTKATLNDDGSWSYDNPDMQRPEPVAPVTVTGDSDLLSPGDTLALCDVLQHIADIKRAADEAEQRAVTLRERLMEAMMEAGVKTWENEVFRATVKLPTVREGCDTKALKRDHPDIYDMYKTTTPVKASILIKLK